MTDQRKAAREQDKRKKLMEKLENKSNKAKNRLIALVQLIERGDDDSLYEYFNDGDKLIVIYNVFIDTASGHETNCRKGRSDSALFHNLLIALQAIIKYLKVGYISKGWQVRSIAGFLEKALYWGNKYQHRKFAFQILLDFLQTLEDSHEGQIGILAGAIPLEPFTFQYGGATIRLPTPTLQPNVKTGLVSPSTTPPSAQESVEMFQLLLDFAGKQGAEKFGSWLAWIKQHYLCYFFPQVTITPEGPTHGAAAPAASLASASSSASTPAVPSSSSSSSTASVPISATSSSTPTLATTSSSSSMTGRQGFPHCPHEVLEVLINILGDWMAVPAIAHHLWLTEENQFLLLEIYSQSLRLPVSLVSTTGDSIALFERALMSSPPKELDPGQLVRHRRYFLNQLSAIFQTEPTDTQGNALFHLCCRVIQLWKKVFMEAYETLEDSTRDTLLETVITSATGLLGENSTNMALANYQGLAHILIDSIFFIWIRTQTRAPEHWRQLQEGMGQLFHREETIENLKNHLIQLTMAIVKLQYPARTQKTPTTRKLVTDNWGSSNASSSQPQEKKILPSRSPDWVEPPTLPPADPAISSINWTIDNLVFCWNEILQILRNVNKIKSPKIHHAGIVTMNEACSIILHAEEAAPFAQLLDENGDPKKVPKPLELVNSFGPRLFDACGLQDKFVLGKADAYAGLCRLILRHAPAQIPQKILSHFYSLLHLGLTQHLPGASGQVQFSIILNASNLFNLGLPGANCMIPYYLVEARRIFDGSGASLAHKKKAIFGICSLLCQCNPLHSVELPIDLDNKQRTEFTRDKSVAMPAVFAELISLLRLVIKSPNNQAELKVLCIWGLCVGFIDQVCGPSPNAGLSKEIIQDILQCSRIEIREVARAALDALSTIVQTFGLQVVRFDSGLAFSVIEALSESVRKLIVEKRDKDLAAQKHSGSHPQEHTIAHTFHCLQDWIMCLPKETLKQNPQTVASVCAAIEIGLLGAKLEPGVALPLAREAKDQPSSSTRSSVFPRRRRDHAAGQHTSNELGVAELLELLRQEPTHESRLIQLAAEEILMHLAHYLGIFPFLEGVEIDSSQISEIDDMGLGEGADDPKSIHYVFSESVIISLIEVPNPNGQGSFARLILRDVSGKYAWDTDISFDRVEAAPPSPLSFHHADRLRKIKSGSQLIEPTVAQSESTDPLDEKASSSRAVVKAPRFSKRGGQQDKVNEMLQFLTGAFPDCLPDDQSPLDQPAPTLAIAEKEVNQVLADLTTQQSLLSQYLEQRDIHPPDFWSVVPPSIPVPISKYHHCRQILSHLSLLQYNKRDQIAILEPGQKLKRELSQLDITPSRETCKIGLVLVREGQDDQLELLKNEEPSGLYAEFVRGLGWPIDVGTHRGYLGGLDSKGSTGTTAPYWANNSTECIYHATTSMPTSETDQNQIHIKRHIGNDNVNIVYSEHLRDYDPHTIRTEFNDSIIVVYPLPSGLFRIQIYQKDSIPTFGPLLHGMVIPKHLLAPLVRQTAINANRSWRSTQEGYTRSFVNRRNAIAQAVTRYKQSMSYANFVTHILKFAGDAR